MTEEIERTAEKIHNAYPVTMVGQPLKWDYVVAKLPERADVYRRVAREVIEADRAEAEGIPPDISSES